MGAQIMHRLGEKASPFCAGVSLGHDTTCWQCREAPRLFVCLFACQESGSPILIFPGKKKKRMHIFHTDLGFINLQSPSNAAQYVHRAARASL